MFPPGAIRMLFFAMVALFMFGVSNALSTGASTKELQDSSISKRSNNLPVASVDGIIAGSIICFFVVMFILSVIWNIRRDKKRRQREAERRELDIEAAYEGLVAAGILRRNALVF